jgi:hypothetical protein
MLRRVVIVAIRNKKQRYMSLRITKFNICVIGMLIGIGLIGSLPLLHKLGAIGYSLF